MPEGGFRALSVFIALVANLPSLIAAVGGSGASVVSQATLQAAVGQGVAGKTTPTIYCIEARDTAVSSRLATRQPMTGTIRVSSALDAHSATADGPVGALAQGTASGRATARGTRLTAGSAHSSNSAALRTSS